MGVQAVKIVQKLFPEVTSVRDAKHKLKVEVTKEINRLSTVKNHKKCAMAVACEKKSEADGVVIGLRSAYIIKGTTAIRYEVPERVAREVISFDRNGGFAEGEYELRPPTESRQLGYGGSGKTHNKGSGRTQMKRVIHKTKGVRTDLREKIVD